MSQKTYANIDVKGTATTDAFIKTGGLQTEFLKADGSVDSNAYITSAQLPSNLILYPTTGASDVGGYTKMVNSLTDPDYNTTAVDVTTGDITVVDQLISSLITAPNLLVGDPGIFELTVVGNIRKTIDSGSGQAVFYFKIYKRTSVGVETLLGTSNNTLPVNNGVYAEFSADAIWNDGIFASTDRIVFKFYGSRVPGGSNPNFQFQFGGETPVRSIVPIPNSVIPPLYLRDLVDVEDTVASNNDGIFYNTTTGLWEHKAITASLVTDFDAEVANNTAVTANTAKISFDSASSTRLANTSGTNTGDQDLSTYTNQGNTFNGANQLVQLDGTGKLPAIDGSLLINLPSSGASVLIDDVAPTVAEGLWFQPTSGVIAVGVDSEWVETIGLSGAPGLDGATIVVDDTPPAYVAGGLWYSPVIGALAVGIDNFWVVMTGAAGTNGTNGIDATASAGTGTILDLTRIGGYYYNMSAASAATTYTTTGTTLGAFACTLINAATEPVVTGATKIKGSDFIVSTDMQMWVQYFGVTVQYFFTEL